MQMNIGLSSPIGGCPMVNLSPFPWIASREIKVQQILWSSCFGPLGSTKTSLSVKLSKKSRDMLLAVISFVALCAVHAKADIVNTVDCQNVTIHSKDVQMEVSGCGSDLDRCPLYQGHNHTVTFLFEPTHAFLNKTDFRVHGLFPKFSVPYRGKTDACEASNSTEDAVPCPRQGGFLVGKQYRHHSLFAVSKNYPKIQLSVRFSMTDRRSKETLLCKEIPVEIRSAPSEENEAIH